jgi:hypothetical protein
VGGTGGTHVGGAGSTSMNECSAGNYADPTCGTCIEANCALLCASCEQSADCHGWVQCVASCTDPACESGCTQQYPQGAGPAQASLVDCRSRSCAADCGSALDCGLTVDGSYPQCDSCVEQSCCGPAAACSYNQGCLKVLQCTQSCDDSDTVCKQACLEWYPDGAKVMGQLFACLDHYCPNACPI